MSDEWRVDPDRVLGILAGIDEDGARLVTASDEAREIAASSSSLQVDGRSVMSSAWSTFWAERQSVPGKMVTVIGRAAEGVSAATVDIIAGDTNMAQTEEEAAAHALDAWGIHQMGDYIN